MKKEKLKDEEFLRIHKQSFTFNQRELQAFMYYCKKYRVKNKSKFMRETVVTAILKRFDEDYPTLFDVEHMERPVNK